MFYSMFEQRIINATNHLQWIHYNPDQHYSNENAQTAKEIFGKHSIRF